MGSSAEQFDAWFKERLEHFEERPRDAAWENIAEKLGHTRQKRLMVFIVRIAAGMALTFSLGLGYYYYIQHRVLSVTPSMAENQQIPLPLNSGEIKIAAPSISDEIKMAAPSISAPSISKDFPETASSLPGISSAVQSENLSVGITGPAEISGHEVLPVDSAYERPFALSGPSWITGASAILKPPF